MEDEFKRIHSGFKCKDFPDTDDADAAGDTTGISVRNMIADLKAEEACGGD